MVRGTIKIWDNQRGFGVLVSPELPGEILAEVSAAKGRLRDFVVGATVLFDYEPVAADPNQHHAFRAVWVKSRGAG